jgi:hypothetical protein
MPSAYVQTRVAKDGSKRHRAVLERSVRGKKIKDYGSWGPYYRKAKKQAEQLKSAAYDRKLGLQPEAETHFLSELIEEFRAARTKLQPKTIEADEAMIDVILQAWGDLELHAITKGMIVKLRKDLSERLAEGSVGIRLRSLKTMLYYALEELGWLTRHPMLGVTIPESPDRERVYADDEFWKFLELADDLLKGPLILARTRALRKGEILLLGEEGSKRYLIRDEDGDYWLRLRNPRRYGIKSDRRLKTGRKGERDVHVPAEALPYMDVEGTEGAILPNVTDARLRKRWEKLRRLAGISGRWHDWKHTAVTHLGERGASKQDLLDLTGNTEQSLKKYDHALRRAPKEILGRGFPSKSPSTEPKKKADASAPADSPSGKVVGASGLEPEASCSQSRESDPIPPSDHVRGRRCPTCRQSVPLGLVYFRSGRLD